MILSSENFRRLSGFLFLAGNVGLFITNFVDMNVMQFIGSILLITCSIAVILSSWNHRWLFYGGTAVFFAYLFVGFSAPENGGILQKIGSMAGVMGAFLILRAAFQRETGKQFKLAYPFNLIDLYPMAAAGILEGAFCCVLVVGAYLNGDIRLALAALVWCVAHTCLILSDEYLRKRFNF